MPRRTPPEFLTWEQVRQQLPRRFLARYDGRLSDYVAIGGTSISPACIPGKLFGKDAILLRFWKTAPHPPENFCYEAWLTTDQQIIDKCRDRLNNKLSITSRPRMEKIVLFRRILKQEPKPKRNTYPRPRKEPRTCNPHSRITTHPPSAQPMCATSTETVSAALPCA